MCERGMKKKAPPPFVAPAGQAANAEPAPDVPKASEAHQRIVDQIVKKKAEPAPMAEPSKRLRDRAKQYKVKLVKMVSAPHGAKALRCHFVISNNAKAKESGPYQCPKPARKPTAVCASHGAGTRKLVEEGKRQDPVTSGIITGEYVTKPMSKQEIDAAIFKNGGDLFRNLYDQACQAEDLLNFREELVMARAIARWYMTQHDLKDRVTKMGVDSPADRAIGMLAKVVKIGEGLIDAEKKRGPISHTELSRFMDGINLAVARIVPQAKHTEFYRIVQSVSGGLGGSATSDNDVIDISE